MKPIYSPMISLVCQRYQVKFMFVLYAFECLKVGVWTPQSVTSLSPPHIFDLDSHIHTATTTKVHKSHCEVCDVSDLFSILHSRSLAINFMMNIEHFFYSRAF